MIELAISDMPHFKIDLSEAETDVHSYTYSTMQKFNRMYPECELLFLFSAQIRSFAAEEWRYFKEIFPTCTILAAMRDDKDVRTMQEQISYLKERYGAKIELLRAPLLEISSTTIRKRAAMRRGIRYIVPDSVSNYIKEHELYQTNEFL